VERGTALIVFVQGRVEITVLPAVTQILLQHIAMDIEICFGVLSTG